MQQKNIMNFNPNDNPILSSLNERQREAAEHTEGPLLVLAGAGTGKTKVLTSRIANIIAKGTFPSQILAVTFTNKAAREMSDRIAKITGTMSEGIWLGTFHSICAKILRIHSEALGFENNFTIIDSADQIRLLKQILEDYDIDEKRWPAKNLLSIISRWKDQGLVPEKVSFDNVPDYANGMAVKLYKDYQDRLKRLNAMDFGDLLLYCIILFLDNPEILAQYHRRFKYILVDEYQDTNIAQYLWLRLLAQANHNICCVGDDDQSIYGWRGAEVGNILKFEKDFPNAKVIRLERNYRSTSHILNAASGLISNNSSRLGKTLWTEDNEGEAIKLIATWDDREEANYIAMEIESLQQISKHTLSEIAILVRAGFQTREFEESFLSHGIAYKVIGGLRFYERMEIKDIISYLRVTMQNDDDLAFERIINVPKRGIGASTMLQIRQYASSNQVSMVRAIRRMIEEGLFKGKMQSTMEDFISKLDEWKDLSSELNVAQLADRIVDESGYLQMWQSEKTIESQGRVDNIKELMHALEEFENVSAFLEHVSLITDIDTLNQSSDMVNIMTLHSAKGLEFDTVFLPGWEEGLFPHQRSIDEKGSKGLEEERRLAYVGITRAKKRAYILFAANRRVYGQYQSNIPSRFIEEIPSENTESININNGFNFRRSDKPAVKQQAEPIKTIPKPEKISKYNPGGRVFHEKFGYGTILIVNGNQLDIFFEKAGKKKIMADFVRVV